MEKIMEIRDSKLITDILNKAFNTVALQFNYTKENAPKFPAFIKSDVIENELNKGLKMYGYYMDRKIIGCAGYSHYKNQIFFIERLATLPEYRHQGIGKKLMEYAENKMREENGRIIEIHVVDENLKLIEWYKKSGYLKIRVDKIKTLPFNSCVMNKILE